MPVRLINEWRSLVYDYAIAMNDVLGKFLGGVYNYVIGVSGLRRRLLVWSFF